MPGRVLVVAYNFPPIGGVGVQRTLKFVTYLPRWGWDPVVLTARDPGVAERDPNNPATWGKIGRNEPCPCGSGKKFKHCHGQLV